MAGREGFEPPEVLPSTVFKTAAFNHSAISRDFVTILKIEIKSKILIMEATPRFELGNQGFAGPCLTTWLCRLNRMVPEAGLEPARKQYPRDFKSLVSTNSTTRAIIQIYNIYNGAGNEVRTRDPNLGKVVLYH